MGVCGHAGDKIPHSNSPQSLLLLGHKEIRNGPDRETEHPLIYRVFLSKGDDISCCFRNAFSKNVMDKETVATKDTGMGLSTR